MTQYKTLRDLPGCPVGTVFVCRNKEDIYQPEDGYNGVEFDGDFIKTYPDWFAEVKEETLEEAAEKLLATPPYEYGDREKAIESIRAVYERVKAEREKK